jgi:hypothetical protein
MTSHPNHIPQKINTAERPSAASAAIDIDFFVSRHGLSLVSFLPVSPAAEEFAEHAFRHAMRFGGSYICETRYAQAILEDLLGLEFIASIDGVLVKAVEP